MIFKRLYVLIAVLAFSLAAFAQKDPDALAILNSMSDKYQSLNAFQADFSYSLINESKNLNEKFTGNILVKGDKYKLVTDEQEVYNNGSIVWTYIPEVEVNIDNYDPDNGDINPTTIYSIYKKGFKYLYLEDGNVNGAPVQVVDLVPEDARNNQIFKIRLEIGKSDHLLKKWTVFYKDGNKYVFTIKSFKANPAVAENAFTFDVAAHKGIDVVDLR